MSEKPHFHDQIIRKSLNTDDRDDKLLIKYCKERKSE
jgi:hypothetical protein